MTPAAARDPLRLGRERGGRQVERRGVDQVPHQVDRLGDHLAAPRRVGVAVAGEHGDRQVAARGSARYLRKLYAPSSAPVATASASSGVSAGSATVTVLAAGGRHRWRPPSSPRPTAAPCPPARRSRSASNARALGRRLAEPDREHERGGQLAAAGNLGELLELARRAKCGERVGEGTAERLIDPGEPGCGCSGRPEVWITPMTRTSASAVSGADSLVARETVTKPMLLHPDATAIAPRDPRRDRRHRGKRVRRGGPVGNAFACRDGLPRVQSLARIARPIPLPSPAKHRSISRPSPDHPPSPSSRPSPAYPGCRSSQPPAIPRPAPACPGALVQNPPCRCTPPITDPDKYDRAMCSKASTGLTMRVVSTPSSATMVVRRPTSRSGYSADAASPRAVRRPQE